MTWAEQELGDASLGDARLSRRLVKLATRLAESPSASIPQACRGWAEMRAAYRFLAKDKVDWQDMLQPHWDASLQRMREHPVVLCLQDTTELDFEGKATRGLGPLSYEAQRGMYLHPTYAVTPGRVPLGVIDAWMWAREFKDKDGNRPGLCESVRWIEGYERVAEQAHGIDDFMGCLLPHYCRLASQLIGARAAFLHQESGFFDSFLVKEGLLDEDRFVPMFGIYGMAEAVNILMDKENLPDRYGHDEEANQLGYRISAQLSAYVTTTPQTHAWGGRALLHSQGGLSIDVAVTPGVRIPYGQEPDPASHVLALAPHHTYYHSGISEILTLEPDLLDLVRSVKPDDMVCIAIRQPKALGLGHAVLCAEPLVAGEPFAVLLADDLMVGEPPIMAQMTAQFAELGGCILAVQEVPREHTSRYGILDIGADDGRMAEVKGLVEKPPIEKAPSNLTIIGRYVLMPEVIGHLARMEKGAGGEVQLTDGMAKLIGTQPFHGLRYEGRRFDCGDKAGFLEAQVAYALARPDLAPAMRDILGRYA